MSAVCDILPCEVISMENHDLTEGKVSAALLGFFFPMLLTNLLQQIYALADTAIVGKGLGDNALGAVGNLSSMSLLIIGFSMGITNGFAVIIAQNYGAGDMSSVRRSIALSVKLSAVITVILTFIGCVLLKPVIIAMNTDEVILRDSLRYGYIIFGGLAATVAYNLFSGILRSIGDSKTPFAAIIVSSVLNITLDCAAVFILHTGVEGAAAATVISQGVSAYICFVKLWRIKKLRITRSDFKRNDALSVLLLKNGVLMAFMNSVTAVGCMVVQGHVNGCGVEYTSAYSVCSRYLNLFMLPALTAGFAVSPFVSQNYGAGRRGRIRQGVRTGVHIAVISYICLGSAMIFLSKQLAGVMLNGDETILLAADYLKICGCGLILLNLLFIYRSAAQGLGHPLIPMLSGFAEMALRIPAIIILLPVIGFKATAYAEILAWIGAFSMNFIAFMRKTESERKRK